MKKDIASAKEYYYLYNGHGDVVQIIDRNGAVVNAYTYDEWGNITQQSETIPNSFKYACEIYDNETGLYYLRARYYDPSMGRFINEAYEGQVTNPLSLNLYTYVQNNPLGFVDPSGNDRCEIELMLKHANEFEKDLKKTFKGIYKNDTNQYTYLYNMAAWKMRGNRSGQSRNY
ncbi:RHS repeat-associated core domain-containing protein [Paenibacillus sepulcri]|uniref:RHS repeat-associated core domain-containing protein n=1 Tax=Paenibacillus sepulcri TaxID=359917 RepID=UPI0035EDD1F2